MTEENGGPIGTPEDVAGALFNRLRKRLAPPSAIPFEQKQVPENTGDVSKLQSVDKMLSNVLPTSHKTQKPSSESPASSNGVKIPTSTRSTYSEKKGSSSNAIMMLIIMILIVGSFIFLLTTAGTVKKKKDLPLLTEIKKHPNKERLEPVPVTHAPVPQQQIPTREELPLVQIPLVVCPYESCYQMGNSNAGGFYYSLVKTFTYVESGGVKFAVAKALSGNQICTNSISFAKEKIAQGEIWGRIKMIVLSPDCNGWLEKNIGQYQSILVRTEGNQKINLHFISTPLLN